MTLGDKTRTGGRADTASWTPWPLIAAIQERRDPTQEKISLILERYWKPVYCYLRRSGYGEEEAKDLTQGFFHEVVLKRGLIERADRTKGRFRAFLLHALKQYVIDTKRRQSCQANIPPEKLISLETANPPVLPEAISTWSPEECFFYAWKSAILDETLAAVKKGCYSRGQETHWQVFRDHLLRPVLEGTESPPLKDLCQCYGIDSERTVSNMVITVKRRFRRTLRRVLRKTAGSETEVEEELQDIL